MKYNILVIDDDALITNTLRQLFATWDFEVSVAHTAQEAKEIMKKITPDVVLLDIILTKEDGAAGILDFMKGRENLAHVPVLALTNLEKPELKQLLLAQGVREYIIKGQISMDQLYDKVVSYLPIDK